MNKFFMSMAFSLLGVPAASADPMFYNATSAAYKLEATLPNGAKNPISLSSGSHSLTSAYFLLAAGVKEVAVAALDDQSAPVWSGKAKADDSYVLVPDAKGVKVVYAGVHGSPASPRVILLMNATGEPLTIDLEGHNGVGASRGIVPGPTFDSKKAIRLEATERTYNVKAKRPDGSPVAISGVVGPGRYCLLWKNASGVYYVNSLGAIKP